MTSPAVRLRRLLDPARVSFVMEAHNALSARIVEEAGFEAVWASGLTISASLGLRDCNEASWTQCLDCVEFMADAIAIPILMDADSGYGNFNNVRRLVAKAGQRGVAGLCIEDKLFPKMNSLRPGDPQPLAKIDEFCGRLKAAKDAQTDDAFVVVARIEALVSGLGLREALRRADAYAAAGADAIIIHSVKPDASEVLAFKREWQEALPVVAVPTKYSRTPTDAFRRAGFAALIWANHLLRSSIVAMQRTAAAIFEAEAVSGVEPAIAPVSEIFRLQRMAELEDAEQRYLAGAASGEPEDVNRRIA
jgi:phosphoenolpyruvate phosphomutase